MSLGAQELNGIGAVWMMALARLTIRPELQLELPSACKRLNEKRYQLAESAEDSCSKLQALQWEPSSVAEFWGDHITQEVLNDHQATACIYMNAIVDKSPRPLPATSPPATPQQLKGWKIGVATNGFSSRYRGKPENRGVALFLALDSMRGRERGGLPDPGELRTFAMEGHETLTVFLFGGLLSCMRMYGSPTTGGMPLRKLKPGLVGATPLQKAAVLKPGLVGATPLQKATVLKYTLKPGLVGATPLQKAAVLKPGLLGATPLQKAAVLKPGLVGATPLQKAAVLKPGLVGATPLQKAAVLRLGLVGATPLQKATVLKYTLKPGLVGATPLQKAAVLKPGLLGATPLQKAAVLKPGLVGATPHELDYLVRFCTAHLRSPSRSDRNPG